MTTPENEHPEAAPTQPIPPVAHPTNPFTPPHPAAPADQRAQYDADQRAQYEAAQRQAAQYEAAQRAAAAQAAQPTTAPIPYVTQSAPQQGAPVASPMPWFGEQQPVAVAAAPAGPKKRSVWLPATAAAAVGAIVAGIAVFGITNDEGDGSDPSAASLATIGQTSNDAVPVSGSTSDDPDWQAVSEAVKDSVVAISVTTSAGGAQGSGVIIDDSGHIVTNNHVVSGADEVSVTLSDGRIIKATVVGTDPTTDLAVIKLTDAPSGLVAAAIGDSTAVAVGEPVMAVGNPLGLANTVTTGIVSALDRPVSTQGENGGEGTVTNAIQVDAAVNPGNSGGPLFDAKGRVIGINSSIATLSSESGSIGLGFAIPSNLVKNVAAQLISDGTAKHAFLGVTLNDGTATADGITRAGAVVQSVSEGSPAAKASLQNGDVVVAINDKPVGGAESLTAYVRALTTGDEATLTIVRDGKALDVKVTLATREDAAAQSTPDQTTPGDGSDQTTPGDGSDQTPGDGSDQTTPGDDSQGLPGDGSNLGSLTPEELYQWFQEHQGDLGGQG